MIVITVGPERRIDPGHDELGRDRIGYGATMSPLALYDASRGPWHLGERAHREHFALMTFDGVGVLAVEIDRIEPIAASGAGQENARRSVIHGDILATGHPLHDAYVGETAPIPPQRNPIGYYDAPQEQTPCLCGCDQTTPAGKDFIPGHDQTALHDRVRQIGTVRDFVDWFDRTHGNWPELNVIYEPVKLDGTLAGKPAQRRHRLGCEHFYADDAGKILNPPRVATPREMASLKPCKTCMAASAKAALTR